MVVGSDGTHLGNPDAVSVVCTDGIKVLFPQLISSAVFDETGVDTLTMFYDAYYDFGIIGVCLVRQRFLGELQKYWQVL